MDIKFPNISILRQLARDQLVSHLENVSIFCAMNMVLDVFVQYVMRLVKKSCNFLYYRPRATPTCHCLQTMETAFVVNGIFRYLQMPPERLYWIVITVETKF